MNSTYRSGSAPCLTPNRKLASVRAISVLPTPVGRGRGAADGPIADLRPAREATNRAGKRRNGLVLRDHALVQFFFHAQQFCVLFFP